MTNVTQDEMKREFKQILRKTGFSPTKEPIADLCDGCTEQLKIHKRELHSFLWNLYRSKFDNENGKEMRHQKIIEKLHREKLYEQKKKEAQQLMKPNYQRYQQAKTSNTPYFESMDLPSNNEEFNSKKENQDDTSLPSCSSITYNDFKDRLFQNICDESETDTDSDYASSGKSSNKISEIPDFCRVDYLDDMFPSDILQRENTEQLKSEHIPVPSRYQLDTTYSLLKCCKQVVERQKNSQVYGLDNIISDEKHPICTKDTSSIHTGKMEKPSEIALEKKDKSDSPESVNITTVNSEPRKDIKKYLKSKGSPEKLKELELDNLSETQIEQKEEEHMMSPGPSPGFISKKHDIIQTSNEFPDVKIKFVCKIEPGTFNEVTRLVEDFDIMLDYSKDVTIDKETDEEISTSENDDEDTEEESAEFIFMTEFEPKSENSSDNIAHNQALVNQDVVRRRIYR